MKTMRKLLIIVTVLSLFSQITFAQLTAEDAADVATQLKKETSLADTTKNWKFGGVTSVNITQAAFSNWSAGGENSLALNALVSLHANYKKNRSTWDNTLDLAYGMMAQESQSTMKTDDKIDFSSKYGYRATKHWYYSALLNFKTQFTHGYDYPNDSVAISNFFAPAYLIGAIGMDYKPHESFSAFLSPITSRTIIVNDKSLSDAGAFGVDPGDIVRNEFGGYVRLMYNNSFFDKTMSLTSKLELFTNYLDSPQNVDVNWENIIGFKINKYISATLTTQLMYDDDVKSTDKEGNERGPKVQFKEVLGIGFLYKF